MIEFSDYLYHHKRSIPQQQEKRTFFWFMNISCYAKQQLSQDAALTDDDMVQIQQRRRDYNRLGFAYQLGFVRLFVNRQAEFTM